MKKKISLLLVTVGVLTIVGCGNGEATTKKEDKGTKVESKSENSSNTKSKNEVKKEVLLDNEIAKITLVGIDKDGFMGPGLKVEIENKLDKTITIQTRETSVDGVMSEPIFSCEIAAGKKAKDTITFDVDNISDLVNIEGLFYIITSDDWDEIGSYPFTTLQGKGSSSSNEVKGTILLDNDILTISYLGQGSDSIYGPELKVEIINKTDSTITVQTREISVDGYMADPIFSCEIAAGKKANDAITFMDEDVTELKNIEGIFCVLNADLWDEIGSYSFNIEK